MSLRTRMLDAEALWRKGRTEGALLSILIAVEVTARKRYPKGTDSKTKVDRKTGGPLKMGDGEAFRTFLREELGRHGVGAMRVLMDTPPSSPPKLPNHPKMPTPPEWDPADPDAYWEAHRKWEDGYRDCLARWENRRADFDRAMATWTKTADKYLMDLEQVFWKLCRCKICHEGGIPRQVTFVEHSGLYSSLSGVFSKSKIQRLRLSKKWVRLLAMTVILAKENKGLFSDRSRRFWQKSKPR